MKSELRLSKNSLSVQDALLAMQVYDWSAEQIIERAALGNLIFDKEKFLKAVEQNGVAN